MRAVLITFCLAFAAMATLGFVRGRSDLRKPDYLRNVILSHVDVLVKQGTLEKKGQCELIYRSRNQILYRFDVAENSLTNTAEATRAELEKGFESRIKFPLDESFILTLFGGSTAGFTLKGAMSGGQGKRRIVAAILGGVTGFSVGYKVATYLAPGPESEMVLEIVKNEQEWRKIEREYFTLILGRAFRIAGFIKDKEVAEGFKRRAVAIRHLSKAEEDVGAVEFVMAANLFNEVGAHLSDDLKKLDETPWWLSWWWISCCMIVACAAFMAISHLWQHKPSLVN